MPRGAARPAVSGLRVVCLSAWVRQPRGSSRRGRRSTPTPRSDRTALPTAAANAGIGRVVADLRLPTLQGGFAQFSTLLEGRRGLVVVVTSAGCPISRKYAPRVAALEATYEGRIAFVYVNVVEGESAEKMREQVKDYSLRGPYATDGPGAMRRELRPRTTTEVYLLSADRKLLYRGAVDDQYRLGGAATVAGRHYLREAIEAMLAGKCPATEATIAPGCLVDMPTDKAPAGPASPAAMTYYPAVARVIAENCVDCHRLGGAAPFGLEAPGAIEGRAAMIEAVVREGLMPPNHGRRDEPGGAIVRDRTMPEPDRALLLSWLRSGRAQGASEGPPTRPPSPNTWEIGPPDVILTTAPLAMLADGPVQHARILVPVNTDADRYVQSIECRAVMRNSIEQAVIWLVPPGGAVPLRGAVPPGTELFATFTPGENILTLPAGAGRLLPTGSLLVVDMYAQPMGKPAAGQLRIAVKFTPLPGPPERTVRSLIVSARELSIPPDAASVQVEASTVLQAPLRLLAISPLMRSRGKELTVEAAIPGQPARTLLFLGRYDPRWLIRYELTEPIDLPAGTCIAVRASYDNSARNPANPDHTKEVKIGPAVGDELLVVDLEHLET